MGASVVHRHDGAEPLRLAVQSSFKKVQDDMKQLQQWQQFLASDHRETYQTIEDLRKEAVTTEKFNILKIYLHQIREELKKTEQLHDQVRRLQEHQATKQDLGKAFAELSTTLQRTDHLAKNAVTQGQFRKLVGEINQEIGHIKDDMTSIETKGGKVVEVRIERFRATFQENLDELKQLVTKYHQETETLMKKRTAEGLVQDINKEFNALKSVTEQLSAQAQQTDDRLRRLRKKVYGSDTETGEGAMTARQQFQQRFQKGRNSWKTSSTASIALAFASLITSVALYTANALEYVDWFVIIAIILFVLGIGLRMPTLVGKKG